MQSLWRTVWRVLKKLKIELPYDPTIPLLGVYELHPVNEVNTKGRFFRASFGKKRQVPKLKLDQT